MPATLSILVYTMGLTMMHQLPFEAFCIQPQRLSMLNQVIVIEHRLVFEEHPVHVPELALRCRGFSSFSGVSCMGVNAGDWKMAKDKPQLRTKPSLDLLHDRVGFS